MRVIKMNKRHLVNRISLIRKKKYKSFTDCGLEVINYTENNNDPKCEICYPKIKDGSMSNDEDEFIYINTTSYKIFIDVRAKREGLSRILGKYKRTQITIQTNKGLKSDIAFEIKYWLKQKGYLKNE